MQIDRYSSSWSHTASPKARKKFVAFLSQIPPRGPFLPVVPVFNYRTVNNMRFVAFLDTEEVAGSNPVVPTIFIKNLRQFNGNIQPEIQPEIPQSILCALPGARWEIAAV